MFERLQVCYLKFSCYIEKSFRKQNVFIMYSDQEKYDFLNMCGLCRCARFSQAVILQAVMPLCEINRAKSDFEFNLEFVLT